MDINKQISYWIESAEHDLKTASAMFDTQHYDWCLFIGHLVLEKILKAHFVVNNIAFPPKTHDLLLLASKIEFTFNDDQYRILEQANNFNLEARYPDEKLTFYKVCNEEYTINHFENIKQLYQCLKIELNY